MPDLDALAAQISAELVPVLKRMEGEMIARIEAASVRSALIDREGVLILTFGDGTTRSLGVVVGRDGADGVDGRVGEAGPVGERGERGEPGADGKDGADGRRGEPGADGKAVDLGLDPERIEYRLSALEGHAPTGALIDRDGALILTLADGSTQNVGKVVGGDGVDGKDGERGADGLGFDDLDVTLHGDGRTVVLGFIRGESVKRFEIALPAMIYRGVYDPDRRYAPGDTVTFGGSGWVCNSPTSAKPGETEKAWTLAIKRGRDGKDFAGPQIKVGA
jgi:integrin beta 3